MVDQIRECYQVAKEYPETYDEISLRSRERMKDWASPESVQTRLIDALDNVYANRSDAESVVNQSEPITPNQLSKRAA